MRDGFYLSTYLEVDKLGNLYGLSHRHDLNMSLWHKIGERVQLVHYWEFERISGKKEHRGAFYDEVHGHRVINDLLSKYNISLDNVEEVWGTPGLDTCNDYHSIDIYPEISYHSICHLYSSLLSDSELFQNEDIISLAVDGGPDIILDKNGIKKNLYAGCVSRKGNVDVFPISSPGMLWMIASNYFERKEGTLMALASASKSKTLKIPEYKTFYQTNADGAALLNYFKHLVQFIYDFEQKDTGILFNEFDPLFTEEENKCSMVMKVIQEMSCWMMEANLDKIVKEYNIKPEKTYLSLSGGFSLNCPSNSYLMKKYKFKGFIAPPCVNDCGLSMGIGLYAFHRKMGKFDFLLNGAYYGDWDNSLESILERGIYSQYIKSVSDFDSFKASEDIKQAPIVWFDGRAEIGPRALGHRSMLADPTNPETKDYLNTIKQRQWWRPVAPIVTKEDMPDWFENAYVSPYMLNTFEIKENKIDKIPSVSHLDSSARVQTVEEKTDSRLYQLLQAFKKCTGVPMLCNTSLNDLGEPIINNIEEAFNFSLRKGIRIIYVNGKRIELMEHSQYQVKEPQKRTLDLNIYLEEEREELLINLNPHKIEKHILLLYYTLSELYSELDIQKKSHVRELRLFSIQLDHKIVI